MLRAYLKIAFRNLRKNKVFSLVNIVGLGLGIAAFGLILEYVAFERSVNTFHTNLSTLYRLVSRGHDGEFHTNMAPAVAPLARQKFPEVRAYCRIAESSANGVITLNNGKSSQSQPFRENKLAYADASFFTLFSFPLVQGTASTAIERPNTVALSQAMAQKYFGDGKAVGRTLTLNNQFGKTLYTVSAIYADMPENSDLRFDAVFALQTLANPANLNGNSWARLDGFDGTYLTTFFRLPAGTPAQALEAKFNAFVRQRDPKDDTQFWLQPAANIHLAGSLSDPYPTGGSLGFVYLLSGIAVLILIIAWVNYVNLSTAGTLKRAKEVGIRKAIGARLDQLVGQFLGESILLNVIGFGVAVVLISSLQPAFNAFIQRDLSLTGLASDPFWLAGLGLLMVGALASGVYVAFAMTSFQPVQTLKGTFRTGRGGWLRKSLVVAQFGASVVLVIATLVLYRQLQYMQNKDLGVRLDQRVVIQGPVVGDEKTLNLHTTVLEDQFTALPYVKAHSTTSIVPGGYYSFNAGGIIRQSTGPANPNDAQKSYAMGIIDDRYLPMFGIGLVAGRNFTPREAELAWTKSAKLMVNESAARQLGFPLPAKAVGQVINWGQPFEIVGVVKDYHHQGLRQAIDPIIFMPRHGLPGNFALQLSTDPLQGGTVQRKLAELERIYKAAYPGNPFEFYFVDERYNAQYKSEQQYGRLFTIASALAIFIACLGLFGLATFTTEQRTKEIGVRKVLGASITSIVTLLSKDFLKLVLIAIVIASPLAWYTMHRWLQGFAYRVDIVWWVFVLAGLLAVGVALLTVSFQSIRAALTNPVKSLKTE
jgi:putative ABC transport system permease protein